MEDKSGLVGRGGLTGGSSMSATNTISEAPPFQPPGSESESTAGTTPGWPAAGSPGPHGTGPGDVSAKNTAGPGDRGGILPADGRDPGAGYMWQNVNDEPDTSRWSTAVDQHYRDDRQ